MRVLHWIFITLFTVISPVTSVTACVGAEKLAPTVLLPTEPTDEEGTGKGDDGQGQILVYDYPETIARNSIGYLVRSQVYKVTARQGDVSKDVYVMADRNSLQTTSPTMAQGKKMTNHNNYASFSFDGKVEIVVSRMDGGSMKGAAVYPGSKGYDARIDGNELVIHLDSWAYLYVLVPDLGKEPLFIFADPAEKDVPALWASEVLTPDMDIATIRQKIENTDKKTLYFSPGVYDFGADATSAYPGYKLPIRSGKDYYFPGGTVVIGSFYGTGNVSDTKFFGRGIITGCGKERLAGSESIPYSLYYAPSGENNTIEGLHFYAPPHFCILSRGELTTRLTKMTGWYHQTDGWGGGEGSVVKDCFIKVNDDFLKVYRPRTTVSNIVIYKQINGATIQLGWGSYGAANNCTIEDIFIVNDDEKTPSGIGNTAVVDLMNNDGSTISDIHFKNIIMDNKVQEFLCLNGHGGTIKNLVFENIQEMKGAYSPTNHIATQQDDVTTYENFKFINYCISGKKVSSTADMNLQQCLVKDGKIIDKNCNFINPSFE